MKSRRSVTGVLAVMAALGVGACGSSNSSTSTSTARSGSASTATTSSAAAGASGGSAAAVRDKLLALAKPGTTIDHGAIAGWPKNAQGSAIPATPSAISGWGFAVDKRKNIQFLSFAVTDSKGHCVGGDIQSDTAGNKVVSARPVTVKPGSPCSASTVAAAVGHY